MIRLHFPTKNARIANCFRFAVVDADIIDIKIYTKEDVLISAMNIKI